MKNPNAFKATKPEYHFEPNHFEHYACLASAHLANETQDKQNHTDNLLDTLVAMDNRYLRFENLNNK
ncbi:MAG: hypothetical protein OXE99_05830 [Cellvibrionales bacterium]|nr:hypothetical protein [Cellvibrionales bacterium]